MKKKMSFTLLILMLLFTHDLIAQNWIVGGNILPAGGGELGSNNNQHVFFETNGSRRGMISNSGRWGFGITNAGAIAARVHIRSTATLNPLQVDVGNVPAFLVNSSGFVGIGTTTPNVKLHIEGGSPAGVNSGGYIVAGPLTGINLAIDDNSINARNDGSLASLYLNSSQIFLSPSGGHVMIGGESASANLYLDNQEIQSRNNGTGTILHLNPGGGLVQTGDNLDVNGSTINLGTAEAFSDAGSNTIGSNSTFVPTTDNLRDLGSSSLRWNEVWAADGTINTSDMRDKTNIRDLNYGLKEILQLRSIRFNWKNTAQERKDKLGIIAQEIQRVLPEVVRDYDYVADEKTGTIQKVPAAHMGVMYADIIPVLIRAIQEQEQKISSQDKKIEELTKLILQQLPHTNSSSLNSATISSNSSSLYQNAPNPFNKSTTVAYNLPQKFVSAQIIITDKNGKILKKLNISGPGKGTVNIDAATLSAGTYNYSLIVDGRILSSKQMILTK